MVGVLDFKGEIYTRQERNGILLGTYEKACKPWSPVNTPWDFGHELLPPDLDRIAPSLEVGFQHFPALANAGIKQVINGPFTFAPDGNPLVGPVQGLTNFWCACAVMAGFSQGGGVGLALSNWMVDGDPGFDVWGMDVARFGEWATPALHQRQGARELFAPLLDPLPERGAAGGAAGADDAALRHDGRAERRDGRFLGPGDAAVVRAEGHRAEGHRLLPPLQRFRACRQRGARDARAASASPRSPTSPSTRSPGAGAEAFLNRADDQPHAEDRAASC